jgi:hypothetical protein
MKEKTISATSLKKKQKAMMIIEFSRSLSLSFVPPTKRKKKQKE